MLNEIKQPYVLIAGVALAAIAIAATIISPEKPALLLTVAVATGMATKATVSMRMAAPNTSIGLFVLAGGSALTVIGIMGYVPTEDGGSILKASVVLMNSGLESFYSGLGGLGIALLGEAQVRPRDPESDSEPKPEPEDSAPDPAE